MSLASYILLVLLEHSHFSSTSKSGTQEESTDLSVTKKNHINGNLYSILKHVPRCRYEGKNSRLVESNKNEHKKKHALKRKRPLVSTTAFDNDQDDIFIEHICNDKQCRCYGVSSNVRHGIFKDRSCNELKFKEIIDPICRLLNLKKIEPENEMIIIPYNLVLYTSSFFLEQLKKKYNKKSLDRLSSELIENKDFDLFIDEYVRNGNFMSIQHFFGNENVHIHKTPGNKIHEVKDILPLVKMHEIYFYDILKCKPHTRVVIFNKFIPQQISSVLIFGCKFMMYCYMVEIDHHEDSLLYFIHKSLIEMRSSYHQYPELISFRFLITDKLLVQNLYKILVYFHIISKLQTQRLKVLFILDEILNILQISNKLRDNLKTGYWTSNVITTDLFMSGVYNMNQTIVNLLLCNLNMYDWKEEILRIMMRTNCFCISQNISLTLFMSLYHFVDVEIDEFVDFIELLIYNFYYNELDIVAVLKINLVLYNFITERRKDLKESLKVVLLKSKEK